MPDGARCVGNGVPGAAHRSGGWTTWRWSEATPMASYLATVVIGKYRVPAPRTRAKPMVIAIADPLPADGRRGTVAGPHR